MRLLAALICACLIAVIAFVILRPASPGTTVKCYINDDPSAVFYNTTSLRSTPTGVRVETTDGTVYLLHTEPRELCEMTP